MPAVLIITLPAPLSPPLVWPLSSVDPGLHSSRMLSSLFSMLPAPKVANPVTKAKQGERVLGGGGRPGLVFNSARSAHAAPAPASVDAAEEDDADESGPTVIEEKKVEKPAAAAGLFMPTNVRRGKANVSLEESTIRQAPKPTPSARPAPSAAPAVDFFDLGTSPYVHS